MNVLDGFGRILVDLNEFERMLNGPGWIWKSFIDSDGFGRVVGNLYGSERNSIDFVEF